MDAEEQQHEQEHISFDLLQREPVAVFAEVERGKRVIVEYGGKSYRISPVRRRGRTRKSHRLTSDDPIFDLAGMGDSHGPGDVSLRVDDYLAQAYLAEFERLLPTTTGEMFDKTPTEPRAPTSSQAPDSTQDGYE